VTIEPIAPRSSRSSCNSDANAPLSYHHQEHADWT
jgi:hypothetical protein